MDYTPEEVEHLLGGAVTPACVKASILSDGRVMTRPSRVGRVIVASVIAPALLTALATSNAMADPAYGMIVGLVDAPVPANVRVTVIGTGVRRSARVDDRGSYFFHKLPPGSYRLTFREANTARWVLDDVVVQPRGTTVRNSRDPALGPIRPKGVIGEAIMPPAPVPPS